MDYRRAERTRKRMACSIVAEDGRSTGLILDVSANGLFVQTGAKLDPGDSVTVEFEMPGGDETLSLNGRVARRKSAPARLKSVVQSGIGIQIAGAPEAFYTMVAGLQDVDKAPPRARRAAPPPPPARPREKSTAAKPSRPAAKPSRPAAEPSRPAAKPSRPAAEPSRPAAKPSRPAAEPSRPAAKPSRPAAKPEEPQPVLRRLRKRYKVEVHEIGGRGARIVEVEAMNVAAAGRRALEEVGEGWKVAGCELE